MRTVLLFICNIRVVIHSLDHTLHFIVFVFVKHQLLIFVFEAGCELSDLGHELGIELVFLLHYLEVVCAWSLPRHKVLFDDLFEQLYLRILLHHLPLAPLQLRGQLLNCQVGFSVNKNMTYFWSLRPDSLLVHFVGLLSRVTHRARLFDEVLRD